MAFTIDEHQVWPDAAGKPVVAGKVFFGTQNDDPTLGYPEAPVNLLTIYSDRDLKIPMANPQTIGSNGRTANKVYVAERYSLAVWDANDVQKYINLDNGEGDGVGVTKLSNVQGTNTITAEASPTITTYADGELYSFTLVATITGAVTLNIDNVGAKSVVKYHDLPLVENDIEINQKIVVSYNETDDTFELISNTAAVDTRTNVHNLLIGSDLTRNPWQRGTSTTVTVNDTYFADRHAITFSGGTANITAEKVALGTPQKLFGVWCTDALKITVNSGTATSVKLVQRIEDVTSFENSAGILSVAIQGSANVTVPVNFRQDFGTTGSPSGDVDTAGTDLTVTTSMQELSSTVTIPAVTGKTIGDDGLETSFLAVEYDLSNVADAESITIPIHQFQKGTIATDFDFKTSEQTLTDCQNTWRKSYSQGIDPGTITDDGAMVSEPAYTTNIKPYIIYQFKTMRTTPTMAWYSNVTGDIDKLRLSSGSDVSPTTVSTSDSLALVRTAASTATGDRMSAHYTADANQYE